MQFLMTENEKQTGEIHDFTDRTLIRRMKHGEQDAATALYLRYAKRLQRLATFQTSEELSHRIATEDIVQTVFRTFFRRAAQGQYSIVDGEDLWKLLLVIALNKIRKLSEYHRAKKRDIRKTSSIDSSLLEKAGHFERGGGDEIAHSVLKLTIEELLSELPESHQQIIRLRIDGNTLPDIVAGTGRAKRTAERVLQTFRERLLKLVGE